MHMAIGILRDYGFGGVMVICFFFLLKWVLEVSKDMLDKMHEERMSAQEIQKGFIEQIKSINEQTKINMLTNQAFFNSVQEAHRFQREEHKELATTLGRINGYRK